MVESWVGVICLTLLLFLVVAVTARVLFSQ